MRDKNEKIKFSDLNIWLKIAFIGAYHGVIMLFFIIIGIFGLIFLELL